MRKQNPMPLILSTIAIALSLFAVYTVTDFSGGEDSNSAFRADVYDVIDDYIAEKSGQAPPSREPVEVSVDDDAMKGDKDAPITIIEFSDYECPFCKRFFTDTFPQIKEKYIDTGKVKYVFRDFPLSFHANAVPAANAAECLRDQTDDDAYFEFHDILFANQSQLNEANYKKWAADFDIDQVRFDLCVDKGDFNAEVNSDFTEGQKYGVTGTPGFFINGVPLSGAQPFAAFEAVIEKALEDE